MIIHTVQDDPDFLSSFDDSFFLDFEDFESIDDFEPIESDIAIFLESSFDDFMSTP